MKYRFKKDEISYCRNHNGSHILSIVLDGYRVERSYVLYTKAEAYDRFQKEFGTYPNDYKPVGVLTLCNFGGLAIMEIEHGIDDYVIVCDNYENGYKNITRNKINYNAKGNPYFIRNGRRWYLSEFMRV